MPSLVSPPRVVVQRGRIIWLVLVRIVLWLLLNLLVDSILKHGERKVAPLFSPLTLPFPARWTRPSARELILAKMGGFQSIAEPD